MPTLSPSSPHLKRTKSFVIADIIDRGNAKIHFSTRRLIGRGGQGEIYSVRVDFLEPTSGQITETRQCVLKKIIHSMDTSPSDSFGIHDEITKGDETTVDHNILKLICVLTHEGQRYALFPFCETFLDRQMSKLHASGIQAIDPLLRAALIVHMITNLLNALSYMHSKGFVHRDIKPANIAFHLGRWCIIDLDLSMDTRDEGKIRGTGYFIHPAGVRCSRFLTNPLNDIFALGVVLTIILDQAYWTALIKFPPMIHLSRLTLEYDKIKKEPAAETQALTEVVRLTSKLFFIENDLRILASRMTSLDEQQIPSATALLSVFNELNNCLLTLDPDLNKKLHDYYSHMVVASVPAALSPPRMFSLKTAMELNTSQSSPQEKQGFSCGLV